MKDKKTPKHVGSRVVACATLIVLLAATSFAHPAIHIVDNIWKHVGSREAFEQCRYMEFTWAVEKDGEIIRSRKHTWDRYGGDYVLEFTDADSGENIKVYFNTDSQSGTALKDGAAVDAEENARLLERAYAMYINDSYWLLMPTKLTDPGAKIQFVGHAGKMEADGSEGEFMVIHLFFDKKVGLTPGDEYWVYVTHDGVVARWDFKLEDGSEGEYEWLEEKDCGMGIVLSTRKQRMDGSAAIVFPNVRFSDTMDHVVFEAPGGQ